MNIFVTSSCPVESANYLDNKRRNKMLLESCQLLSSAINYYGGKAPYKTTHINHPCSIWVRQSISNWNWLFLHANTLSNLYSKSTGKIHKCEEILKQLGCLKEFIPQGDMTPFVNCTTNLEKNISFKHINNVHEAYRLYLNERWETDKIPPKWS
jgi:hypothetical protein